MIKALLLQRFLCIPSKRVLAEKLAARAGRTYIQGYRVHLACVEGDIPLAFTVQPISRNDKLFYKQLLTEASKTGVKFRVVAAGRQYDSEELRR